jgi:phosphodiesterase/alkaline phosphatase D-like protein
VKVKGFDDFHATIGNTTHFEVALTGLTAGTTYNYSVQVADGKNTTTTRQYYFRTPVKDATQFTFAVLGDSREGYGGGEYQFNGVNARVMRALATNAFVKEAEFIVHTGDMINGRCEPGRADRRWRVVSGSQGTFFEKCQTA